MRYIDIGSIDRTTKSVSETDVVGPQSAPTRARQWVREGDVLVSLTRPNLNAVTLVPSTLDGAVASTGFDVLRAAQILPEWLFLRVRSTEFVSDICKDLQGVVYPAVRPRDVRRHELPVAPLAEQRRIVDAAASYLSRLDEAEASLERVQRNLKRCRASVLQAAVEGRLVQTEAALARAEGRDYEPASELLKRILAERRHRWEEAELARLKAAGKEPKDDSWKAKYKEPVFPESSGLPDLPEGWCRASADQLAYVGTGATPKRGNGRYWNRGTVPWVTSAAVNSNYVDRAAESVTEAALRETNLSVYPPGTLLVAMYGEGQTRGRASELRIAATTNQALAALVLVDGSAILRAWLRLFFEHNYEALRRFASGGVQPNLNLGIVRSIAIPMAPQAEQKRIVEEVDRLLSDGREAQRSVAESSQRCQRLRQSILKWALEGKLVDQDPNDEPASVLLERIQAEREAADNGITLRSGRRARRRRESHD